MLNLHQIFLIQSTLDKPHPQGTGLEGAVYRRVWFIEGAVYRNSFSLFYKSTRPGPASRVWFIERCGLSKGRFIEGAVYRRCGLSKVRFIESRLYLELMKKIGKLCDIRGDATFQMAIIWLSVD